MSTDNKWVLDVQTKIYSKAKAMLTARLLKKYPKLYITDDDENPTDAQFPTIYIQFLEPSERGQDLEGNGINAVYLTVEVEVTATKTQGMMVAKEVAYEVVDVFKSMMFNGRLPIFANDGSGTKRMVARYSRVIGYNDSI